MAKRVPRFGEFRKLEGASKLQKSAQKQEKDEVFGNRKETRAHTGL